MVDSNQSPLEGALVEMWSADGRIEGQLTDSSGTFAFDESVSENATSLLVRRVGFRAKQIWFYGAGEFLITLAPFVTYLETISVTGDEATCPNRNDGRARRVWEAIRNRYEDDFPVGTYRYAKAYTFIGRVSVGQLGYLDTLRLTPGFFGSSRERVQTRTQQIAEEGYAVPSTNGRRDWFDPWEYVDLDGILAPHFVDPLFGDLHKFTFDPDREGIIFFCPKNRRRPSIEGELEFNTDSLLVRATWRFRTREPIEEAGGEVFFARPSDTTSLIRPVPVVGFYWRKLLRGYFQAWREFRTWETCEGKIDMSDSRTCLGQR